MATSDIMQTIAEARVDARSLSEFVFKPSNFKVTRRLAPPINTLSHYLAYLEALKAVYTQQTGTVTVNGVQVKAVAQAVRDALNGAAIDNNTQVDTLITVTPQEAGQLPITQAQKNADLLSITSFPTIAAAQAAAIANNIKIFIPSGEHTYNTTNADMTLFWGYGQLKDTVTGDIYKPTNGDFVTPEMFGIREKVDETDKLQSMCVYAAVKGIPVHWTGGKEYWFTDISVRGANLNIYWKVIGAGKVTLRSIKDTPIGNWEDDYAIRLGGVWVNEHKVLKSAERSSDVISIEDASNIEIGDLLVLRTTRLIETDHRGQAREGQVHKCRKHISNNRLVLSQNLRVDLQVNPSINTSVSKVNSSTSFVLTGIDKQERDMMIRYTVTSGKHVGRFGYLTNWDNVTKTAQATGRQPDLPNLAVGDTLTLQDETNLVHVKPAKVFIGEGIDLIRNERITAQAGDLGFRGLVVVNTVDSTINGFSALDFSEAGIMIRECYNTYIKSCEAHGANRGYNVWDGTGYGFSIYQSTDTTIDSCTTTRCRRGFDAGGTQQQCWNTHYINSKAFGGGLSYVGEPFSPFGNMNNSGFGTHGGGYSTTYTNLLVSDCMNGYNLRSKGEVINDCRQTGYVEYCVTAHYAAGIVINGFDYNDMTTTVSDSQGHSRAHKRTPYGFMVIRCDNISQDFAIDIKNVTCKSLMSSFIKLERVGDLPPINISNCVIYIDNSRNPETYHTFKFLHNTEDESRTFSRINDLGNNLIIDPKNSYMAMHGFEILDKVANKSLINRQRVCDSYSVSIPNNGVYIINLKDGAAGALVTIVPISREREFFAERMYLYYQMAKDFSPLKDTNKRNIDVYDVPLTGTTGLEGKINVTYAPIDGTRSLYVENRVGKEEKIMIEMTLIN